MTSLILDVIVTEVDYKSEIAESKHCLIIERADLKFLARSKWTPCPLNERGMTMFRYRQIAHASDPLEWGSKADSNIAVVSHEKLFPRDFIMEPIKWRSILHLQAPDIC